MKFASVFLLTALLFLLTWSSALAETRYVSDLLVVTVRDQKGDTYNVLETLITATPVEILEEDKNYVKVTTPKGTEGYIRKQYITKELPKALQIKNLKNEVAALQQQLTQIQQSSKESLDAAGVRQSKIDTLTQQLKSTQQELEKTALEYQQLLKNSEYVLNLSNENEQL
ncbi:MAG: TIGR04211 family SH3 domain-containing protein, partial [Deltaproteobacteria bacterium]|nr:TIGR04211 family SH3 domain-containing protein [Deltaproteobacteria bacterium]